ncbi:MAG TPA: hypothetical protein VK009_09760 [Chloroflexota bacterium]|nr:hypothetical protein [Chloroflexota bacterium]
MAVICIQVPTLLHREAIQYCRNEAERNAPSRPAFVSEAGGAAALTVAISRTWDENAWD